MGTTARWGLRFISRGESASLTRQVIEANADTTDAALTKIAGYVNQLATVIPGGQTVIGLDTDGVPYFDPTSTVSDPVGVGVDTDGVPYFVEWDQS